MVTNPNYWKFLGTIKKLKEKENRCFVCGTTENIVPHHIRKAKQSNDDYYNENNIVLLCNKHHIQYHKENSSVNPKTFGEFLKKNHFKKQDNKKGVLMNFRLENELKISKLKKIIKLLNKTQTKVVKLSVNGKLYDISKIIEKEKYVVFELGDFELIKKGD